MEYPLRPPHFRLSLYASHGENYSEAVGAERYNELRAMEAEVSTVNSIILCESFRVQ